MTIKTDERLYQIFERILQEAPEANEYDPAHEYTRTTGVYRIRSKEEIPLGTHDAIGRATWNHRDPLEIHPPSLSVYVDDRCIHVNTMLWWQGFAYQEFTLGATTSSTPERYDPRLRPGGPTCGRQRHVCSDEDTLVAMVIKLISEAHEVPESEDDYDYDDEGGILNRYEEY